MNIKMPASEVETTIKNASHKQMIVMCVVFTMGVFTSFINIIKAGYIGDKHLVIFGVFTFVCWFYVLLVFARIQIEKIVFTPSEIQQYYWFQTKPPIPISDIRKCTTHENWEWYRLLGDFTFEMKNGEKHSVQAPASIFYQVKEEMQRRFAFPIVTGY
jgi:hypothetical protein